ncbi:MAG: LytTR family DNA-binding domain-containing protein [Clostridiales bacterium]|nr:LytTR family DNA-binding domain-containing protein [Clostridiales bacterium]
MHIAIVEDLKSDQDNLTHLIREYFSAMRETVELSVYGSGEDFLKEFRRGFCSAVFLDIMLGEGMTGVDTARKIREMDEQIPLIFTTSETGFALDSYGVHALDYLVKPVKAEALAWCMKSLQKAVATPVCITVRCLDKNSDASNRVLPIRNLIYVESFRNGTILHTISGELRCTQTYAEIVRLLPKTGRFWEYGRGATVNFSFVESIGDTGEIRLSSKNSETLFCSRRKLKDTQAAFTDYQFAVLRNEGVG